MDVDKLIAYHFVIYMNSFCIPHSIIGSNLAQVLSVVEVVM